MMSATTTTSNNNNNNNVSNNNNNNTDRDLISDKELSECDREKLHLIGNVQDGAGHVFFFSHPEARILALDVKILEVPWIRHPSSNSKNKGAAAKKAGRGGGKKKKMEEEEEEEEEETPESKISSKRQRTESEDAMKASPTPSVDTSASEQIHHTASELLGCKLEDVVNANLIPDIYEAINTMQKGRSQRTFRFFSHNQENYAISVSTTTDDFSVIGVEVEDIEDFEATGNFYNTLASLGRVMEFYADEKILGTACETVFKLVKHYDRGMVYRFNDDLSGEVVHEIKKDWLNTSYMGMRFPASDIPLPARQLFVTNGLRYIMNVNSEYNPIIHCSSNVDLSHCRMRAVSKSHIVYLRNMGVISSFTISIVVNGELWGLFAFHGYREAYKPSLHQRIACESIMSMVSVKVESMMRKAESSRTIDLSQILMRWEQSHCVAYNLANLNDGLLKVLDADVIVGKLKDPLKDEAEIVVLGDTALAPSDTFWEKFESHPARKLIHCNTRKGMESLGISVEDCPASGFVFFHDGLVKMMLGRAERSHDVVWAGNPDEPKLRIGGILCPRNSFETFMEKAKKETRAWDTRDLHVISTFMDRVCEHSHNRNATLLKNEIEDANVKYFNALERSEDNSQFFAQMSHELRTPFHGVMGCLNLMHDSIAELSNEEIQDLINTALSTGNHMINLLNDILNISKDKHQKELLTLEPVKILELVSKPVENLRALAESKRINMTLDLEPSHAALEVVTDKNKFIQIISNIVNNSIKFAEGGTIKLCFTMVETMMEAVESWGKDASLYAGTVFTMHENDLYDSVENVKSQVAKLSETKGTANWALASVSDSGCGIKSNELAEILKPYTQSSKGTNRTFQGTGLGLFICVSLCHQLGGFLSCSSTPGVGSVFHIGIPVGSPEDSNQEELPIGMPTVIDSSAES